MAKNSAGNMFCSMPFLNFIIHFCYPHVLKGREDCDFDHSTPPDCGQYFTPELEGLSFYLPHESSNVFMWNSLWQFTLKLVNIIHFSETRNSQTKILLIIYYIALWMMIMNKWIKHIKQWALRYCCYYLS